MLWHSSPQPRYGRHDFQRRGRHLLPRRVGTLPCQYYEPLVCPLLSHHHLRRQDGIDWQGSSHLHRGRSDGRPGARQGRPDQRAQDRGDDPGRALHVAGVGEEAHIAEGGGPGTYIARLQSTLHRCGVANLDLVKRSVLDQG
jgi:hypothetical protein